MGDDPAKALRIARDTGVLAEMFPEFAPMLGFEQQSKYHGLTADEHIFETVQAAADAERRCRCGSLRSGMTPASPRLRGWERTGGCTTTPRRS